MKMRLLSLILTLVCLPAFADALWIDVRSADEYASGHVQEAINIPHMDIGQRIADVSSNKQQEIKLYCRSGKRAGMAKQTLEKMGYTNVTNIGGYEEAKIEASRE